MKAYEVIATVLVLVHMTLVHSSGTVCPLNTKSFGNMCYSFQQENKAWLDANNACKLLGGQLATIDRFSLNEFLSKQWTISGVWIGLKKCNSKWCHPDGKASSYSRWNTGEPNDSGGNEDCVEMLSIARWNDVRCTLRKQFFCEIPPVFSPSHNEILQELKEHDNVTDKKLTNIEHLLQNLLRKSNATKKKKDMKICVLNDYSVAQSGYYNNAYRVTSRVMTDGKTDTGGWGSNTAKTGDYIQATYVLPVYVTSVTVAGGNIPQWGSLVQGYGKMDLEYSLDGKTWLKVKSFPTPFAIKTLTYDLPQHVTAQYWRLKSAEDNWVGTTEFALKPASIKTC